MRRCDLAEGSASLAGRFCESIALPHFRLILCLCLLVKRKLPPCLPLAAMPPCQGELLPSGTIRQNNKTSSSIGVYHSNREVANTYQYVCLREVALWL